MEHIKVPYITHQGNLRPVAITAPHALPWRNNSLANGLAKGSVMVEWRPLRSAGVRPVPEPVATPFVWAAALICCVLLVAVLGAVDGLSSSAVVLGVLCTLAALLGLPARFHAAPGIAVVCWLFLNHYAVAPHGEVAWQGNPDVARLALLFAAAFLGTVAARIVNALDAHHRITPGQGPE